MLFRSFPYTPIANPRYMVADWSFGIQDENMQRVVNEVRAKGAQVVVLLSHNGMDVDLKMATRVRGIDAIFGGHTHDGVPVAVPVLNAGGKTLVTKHTTEKMAAVAAEHNIPLKIYYLNCKLKKIADTVRRARDVFGRLEHPDLAVVTELLRRLG